MEAKFVFTVRKLAEEAEAVVLEGTELDGIDAVVLEFLADLLRGYDRRTWDEAPDESVGLDDPDDDEEHEK